MSQCLESGKYYYARITETTLIHKVTGNKIFQQDVAWNHAYNPSFKETDYDTHVDVYKIPFFVSALYVFPKDTDDFIAIDSDLKYRSEDGFLPSELEVDYLFDASFDINDFGGDLYNDFEEILSLEEIEKAKAIIKEYSDRQDAMCDAWEAQQG